MNSELSSSKPTSCTYKKPYVKESILSEYSFIITAIRLTAFQKDTFCNLKDNIKGPSCQWNEKPLKLCYLVGARKQSEVYVITTALYFEEMISNELKSNPKGLKTTLLFSTLQSLV